MAGSDITGDFVPSRKPELRHHHRLIEDVMAGDDPGDRRQMRREKREQRRERIREALDGLTGGDLSPLKKTIRQAFAALLKIISNVSGKPQIERENGGILNGGKLAFEFKLKRLEEPGKDPKEKPKPVTIELPHVEQDGFTPTSVELSDTVKFKLGKDGLTEVSGIKVNGKLKFLGRETTIAASIGSATLEMKDGKPYLNVEVVDPKDPKKKIPVSVPLFSKDK